jgi:hypothetical protein
LGGSGGVGKRRPRRFEWYRLESGSGSIGRVRVNVKKYANLNIFVRNFFKCRRKSITAG